MEELRKFLVDRGILQQYLQCISDERTRQGVTITYIPISEALTSFHLWSHSESVFPNISEGQWVKYHQEWVDTSPKGIISSRAWLIAQLSSKKLRLLNAIKDFR